MGAVWAAYDEELGRQVAVKEVILPPDVDEGERAELLERTVREARAAARLAHPSIVAVHDVVSEEGRPWIVMELLRGRTLQELIKAGEPLPPERVARLGEELLAALAVAHAQGIQHRDVKPANVFLCDDGRAVLTDFGIARMEGQVTITRSGMLIGSPGYIAPERLRGERGGPLSDLWSLGATLYAAVEGVAPFHAASPVAALHRVLTQEAPPPRRAGAVLGAVLLHMLAREPGDRPDPATAARWLRDAAAGTPVRLPPPPRPPARPAPDTVPRGRSGGPARGRLRDRVIPAVAGIAGVAVVAALAWYGTARDRPDPARIAAPSTAGTPPSVSAPIVSPTSAPITPTVDRGRFTRPVDFCALLTDAQIKRVAPGSSPRRAPMGDGCAWTVRGAGFSIAPLRPHRVDEYWEAITAEAHEEFVSRRNQHRPSNQHLWMWTEIGMRSLMRTTSTAARKVDGIGEEAFSFDLRDRDTGVRVRTVVRFRLSNLLVEAEYANLLPGQAARIRDTALGLTRAAAGRLARGR